MFAWLTRLFTKPKGACSFCWTQTPHLVEGRGEHCGGGVFICPTCARMAVSIFEQRLAP